MDFNAILCEKNGFTNDISEDGMEVWKQGERCMIQRMKKKLVKTGLDSLLDFRKMA